MSYPYSRRRRRELLIRDAYACTRCGREDQPMGLRSILEAAHLDGDRQNDDGENRAILCAACHHAHDYPQWNARRRWTSAGPKDAERPILAALQEAS